MSKIEILHLSDIHFRRQKGDIDYCQDIRKKMIEAVQKHLDEHNVELDVVAVTGDIAFSGKKKNIMMLKFFLKTCKRFYREIPVY